MQQMIDAWQAFWHWVNTSTPDDFNKIVLALVALIALFLGPWLQWRIARRQIQIQAEIANRQIMTQSRIATRQIADNISSKRQNWIDELRKDAAEFLTVVGRIQELKRPRVDALNAKSALADDFKERLESEMRAKELGTRIKLRLNPNKADHNRLVELIGEMASKGYDLNRKYTPAQESEAARVFNEANNAVVRHLQTILKHEWERVKKGDV